MKTEQKETLSEKATKIKIVDNHNRLILSEGRESGMGFAFLEKINDLEFHTVHPTSTCKDYLNEVVYTEMTGHSTTAYGLKYSSKLNIFEDGACYLAIKILLTQSDMYFYTRDGYEQDCNFLVQNHKAMEKTLSSIEKLLNITDLNTTIEPCNDDFFLVTFSTMWAKTTPMISLYSLLLRCLFSYSEEVSIKTLRDTYSYNSIDRSMLMDALSKLQYFIDTGTHPTQRIIKKKLLDLARDTPHNDGIMNYYIPTNTAVTL